MADPWMKFYPQDWRADEKLRMCSLASRGLWIEMLALMHRSDRYGELLIGGIVPSVAQIAIQVGTTAEEAERLISELEAAGVFSVSRRGAIYSRRMFRDSLKSEKARKNGKKGGNPSLSKQTANSASDNPPLKGEDKAQIPDTRSQKPEREEKTPIGVQKKAGSRLPEEWRPGPLSSAAERDARHLGPERVARQLERFGNYWRGKSGRDATKIDWDRTWWNWLSTEAEKLGTASARSEHAHVGF